VCLSRSSSVADLGTWGEFCRTRIIFNAALRAGGLPSVLMSLSFPKHVSSGGFLARPEPIAPGPGQESVWAPPFTRPPTYRSVAGQHAIIKVNLPDGSQRELVNSKAGTQILEESHPPVWYFPTKDIAMECLRPIGGASTTCEFKGQARYFDVVVGGQLVAKQACWTYGDHENPLLSQRVAFYTKPAEAFEATVDGERVVPQEGDFYGGWIVPSKLAGPFKGGPGSRFW